MSKKKELSSYRLLVVAHPDDETLFFSAALLNLKSKAWKVICVTDANADGLGKARALQFKKACKMLGVESFEQWDFPDIYDQRLDLAKLKKKLLELPQPFEVYSHGVTGEYGHPHHQDLGFIVSQIFKCPVWAPAYNCAADKVISLTEKQYQLKSKIYSEVYDGETLRFSQFIPNRNADEFYKVSAKENFEIYNSIIEKRSPVKSKLKKYKWFAKFLGEKNKEKITRPF
jgi:LmbE family N-acetylglucosaminyl deacetylase